MSTRKEASNNLPKTTRDDFMVLETSEQRQSLYDPIRREILRTLNAGTDDFETEVRKSDKILDDGTQVTEQVTVKRPVKRYWMTAQEIVDFVNESHPDLGLSHHNCYYHLRKLGDQGLVEQFPPKDEKDTSSKRIRGMHFRTSAKFLVPTAFEISPGLDEKDVLPPEVYERAAELAQRVKDSGEADAFEYSIKNGSRTHWFSVTMSLYDDGESILSVVRDISETRKIQESLKRSQERLGLALKGAEFAAWEWHGSEKSIFGEGYSELFGFSKKELEKFAANWHSLVHPEDLKMVENKWQEHLSGQTPYFSCEYRQLTKSGEYKWVMDRGSVVEFDSDGIAVRAAGIIRDITFEKLTLQALGQSEEQYQRLVTDSIQGIMIFQNERIVFANPAYAKIVGRTLGEILDMNGEEFQGIIHPDDRAELERRTTQYQDSDDPLPTFRLRYIRPSGEIRWVESYARYVEYRDEKGLQALVVDITDQYNAEQALKQSEERFRNLFENLSDAVFITDVKGNIVFSSPIVVHMFRYEPSELIGQSISTLVHPDDQDWVLKAFTASTMRLEESSQGLEARAMRKDGTIFNFHATGTALMKDGEHIGFQSLLRDISDRMETENALRAQRDLAQMYLKMAANLFLVLDPDGNISLLNRVGRDVLELSDDEDVTGVSWFDFVPKDELKDVKETFVRLMKGELDSIDHYERSILTRKKNLKLVAWRANVLYDDKKKIIGLISSGEDITERRTAETVLKESEEKYRMLVERSIIGMAITEFPPFRIRFVNQASESVMGFSPEEYTSFSPEEIRSIIHPDDRAEILGVIGEIMKGEIGAYYPPYEYRLVRKDGNTIWIRDTPQKVMNEGKPAILSILINVTKDKALVQERAQKLKVYSEMMNAAANGIAIIKEGVFETVNTALLKLLGTSKEKIVGKTIWSKSPRKQSDGVSSKSKMEEIISKIRVKKPKKTQWSFRTSEGVNIPVKLHLKMIEEGPVILLTIIGNGNA